MDVTCPIVDTTCIKLAFWQNNFILIVQFIKLITFESRLLCWKSCTVLFNLFILKIKKKIFLLYLHRLCDRKLLEIKTHVINAKKNKLVRIS